MVGEQGERGVSPVIGVVLLVAVVVILAATVSVYALQFGDQTQESGPSVAITAEYDSRTAPDGESVHLSVQSGDRIETRQLSLVLGDATDSSTGSTVEIADSADPLGTQAGTTLGAGDEFTVNATHVTPTPGGHLDLGDAELQLVWNPPDPDTEETAIIWRWQPTG